MTEIKLTEIGCETGRWMQLVQGRIQGRCSGCRTCGFCFHSLRQNLNLYKEEADTSFEFTFLYLEKHKINLEIRFPYRSFIWYRDIQTNACSCELCLVYIFKLCSYFCVYHCCLIRKI